MLKLLVLAVSVIGLATTLGAATLPHESPLEIAATPAQRLYNEQCAECHGRDGISDSERNPNLAGQKKTYFTNEMKAFKAGTREGTIMPSIAAELTDEEIAALAQHVSRLSCR